MDAQPLLATSLGVVKEAVKEEVDDEVLNPLDMELDDEDLLVSISQRTELIAARRTTRRGRRRTYHLRRLPLTHPDTA